MYYLEVVRLLKTVMISPMGFGSNCWLVIDTDSNNAVIIDPSPKIERIDSMLQSRECVLTAILLTHGHFDHMASVDDIRDRYGVPLCIHENDGECLFDGRKNAYSEFFSGDLSYRPADKLLRDGDVISVGSETLAVLHTPGHTPGSVCYVSDNAVYSGDTLFDRSIGRTDLWGGSDSDLQSSLRRIAALNDSLAVYPGHGSVTTIEKQKLFNPYLKG